MTLLTVKGWVSVHISVQVACEDVLNLTRTLDMLRTAVWQLDPIIEQIVGDPEDSLVDSLTSGLSRCVFRVFFSLWKSANGNPVVLLYSKNLASETKSFSSTHGCQSL